MNLTEKAWEIFNQSVRDYHINDSVDSAENNPFQANSLEWILYSKNWIDTVQWHLEDIIREEDINPVDSIKKEQILLSKSTFGSIKILRPLFLILMLESTAKLQLGLSIGFLFYH